MSIEALRAGGGATKFKHETNRDFYDLRPRKKIAAAIKAAAITPPTTIMNVMFWFDSAFVLATAAADAAAVWAGSKYEKPCANAKLVTQAIWRTANNRTKFFCIEKTPEEKCHPPE